MTIAQTKRATCFVAPSDAISKITGLFIELVTLCQYSLNHADLVESIQKGSTT